VDRLVNQVHPMIQTLFPKNGEVLEDDGAPIDIGQGSKSMKVNFNIFPGQHNRHI
jgi:hypothetical protein